MYVNLPVIEPIAVVDTYISGVACVEKLGGDLYRITHYAVQRSTDGQGECAVIVNRLIASGDTIRANRDCIFREMGDTPESVRVMELSH